MGDGIIEALACRYRRELEVYARGFDPVDPSDLVQEAFLRAVRHARELAELPASAQRRWLYTTLRNLAVDRYRRAGVEGVLEEPDAFGGEDGFEDRLAVADLVERLEPRLRRIVRMRYWLGLTSGEIGRELAVPAATVRYKLVTARAILRRWSSEAREE